MGCMMYHFVVQIVSRINYFRIFVPKGIFIMKFSEGRLQLEINRRVHRYY